MEPTPFNPSCKCLDPQYTNNKWGELKMHDEKQDTECEAWIILLWLVEQAKNDGRKVFAPRAEMSPEDWEKIITLPPTIGSLKKVEKFDLYRSNLVQIPSEIGEMTNLKEFDPYTSYRLHWFPYEITRCKNLKQSRVSTRALYGNYKYRPPFPRLHPDPLAGQEVKARDAMRRCSVCDRNFPDPELHQIWISLRVATDVLPLLVSACSKECIGKLPKPAKGYVDHVHKGGLEVVQPPDEDKMMEEWYKTRDTKKGDASFMEKWFLGEKRDEV